MLDEFEQVFDNGGEVRQMTRSTQTVAAGRVGVRPEPAGPRDVPAQVPLPPSAVALLARSDAELVAAQLAQHPGERLVHAHLAALRAGAALIEVTGRPRRRPLPRTVWDMVSAVAPELAGWTSFFAAGAALRSAVEAGRDDAVDDVRADRTVAAAEDFQDAVRDHLVRLTGVRQDGLALAPAGLRAS